MMTYLSTAIQDQFEMNLNQEDQGILQDQLPNWNLFVNKLYQYFGFSHFVGEVANMLNNFCIKSSNKISTYNVDFICYIFQLDQGNSILCYHYYQGLSNQIQNSIFTQEQDKLILFQNIYTLTITINHCYWKYDYKHYYIKQTEKETLESHS